MTAWGGFATVWFEAAYAKERTDRRKLRANIVEGLLQNGRYQDRR